MSKSQTKPQVLPENAFEEPLFEALPDAMLVVDIDGSIRYLNQALAVMFGYSRDELLGKPVETLVPVVSHERHLQARADYFESPRVRPMAQSLALSGITKTGDEVPVEIALSPVRLGDELLALATVRDISGRQPKSRHEQLMVDSITDYSVILLDQNGIIRSWHQGAENLKGYTADEALGQPVSIFYSEEDRAGGLAEREMKTAAETGRFDYEGWRVRKDGSRFRASIILTPLRDQSGKLTGYVKVTRDITAQSQYARSLIEASLDPLVTISPEGKITDVNEATIAVTGVPREDLVGTNFSDYFTEPEKAQAGYQQVFAEGLVVDYPLTIRHRNGREINVLYNASVYRNPEGEVLGVFAAARDITAQREASQYARSLIEASLDPLVTISPEGKITDVNEATVTITGVSREDLIGSDFSDYFTSPTQAREGYQQVFDKGFVTDYPLTIRHKSGTKTQVLYNASVYKDSQGNVQGVFAAARDITAQREAEELIRRQQDQLLEAQAAVIRELSTPVLQLRSGLLMLPLIGALDSTRARQLTEALLQSVRSNRARVVVLDITGVPAVDSQIANHLVQTVEACRLMGATAVVTGLSAEVAQTLVTIGLELGKLNTVGDLQGGIEYAERLLGYRTVREEGI